MLVDGNELRGGSRNRKNTSVGGNKVKVTETRCGEDDRM